MSSTLPVPAVQPLARSRHSRMHLLMLLVTACWATNIIAGKQALTGFDALALSQLRMLGTAAIYVVAFLASGRMRRFPFTRRKGLFLVAMAAAGLALNQLTFIGGMALSTVAHTGLIIALGPTMVLAIAVVIRLETLTAWKVAGMVIAFAGVGVLTADKSGQGGAGQWLGDLILLAGTALFAIYTILIKEVADQFDALTLNTVIFVLGAVMLLPFCAHALAATNWASLSFEAWWGLGYMIVFGSVVSYALFAYVLTELAASRVAAFNYLQPVIASGLAIWLLSERLTSKVVMGGSLILAGVYLTERERGEEKQSAAFEPDGGRNLSRNHFDDGTAVLGSQDEGQQQAASEASDVGPPGDAARRGALYGQHLKSRDKLNEEPVAQQQDGGNLHGPKDDEERDQGGDAGSGIADEIGPQHSGDGAAGANGGNS